MNFWRRAVDFDYLMEESVIDLEDRELCWFAESAQEIWDRIRNRYWRRLIANVLKPIGTLTVPYPFAWLPPNKSPPAAGRRWFTPETSFANDLRSC